MTTPHCSPTDAMSTHDFVLTDGSNTYGFIYAKSPFEGYQEALLSGGSRIWKAEQKTFTSGRGRTNFAVDPTGFTDSTSVWSMTDQAMFPTLQWKFARGLRSTNFSLPGPMSFQALTGTQLYVSQTFTPSATYTAANSFLWIKKVGTPGNLTVEWCADHAAPNAGTPSDTPLKSITLTAAEITDTTTEFHCFTPTAQSLTGGAVYHIKAYGVSPATAANHWEIGVDVDGATGLQSADGATWGAAAFSLYYRITDADVARKWHPFYMSGAWYVVSQNAASGASLMYINGDRAVATSATGTTIVTSTKSWTADRWIGAKVRIYDGTGDGQVRTITDNDTTSLTVATWDITPDNTSQYVIYSTDWWTIVTGHGLTALSGTPVVTGGIAYFPQGDAVVMIRMTFTSGAHAFSSDGATNKFDLLGLTTSTSGIPQVVGFVSSSANVSVADTTTWGSSLVFSAGKTVGGSDYKITGSVNYNGLLHAFKENGMFRIVNGVPQEVVVGGFASAPNITNGAYGCVQNMWLYVTRANSVIQIQGDNAADIENFRIGYEPVPVSRRGDGTTASAEGWLFRTIDAGSTGDSSILAWNGYGWHEILRGYMPGARIRGTFWQPCPGTRSRLWTDIAGDLLYQEFPENGSNPLRDTNCVFQHEGIFITPTIDVNERNFYKFFKDVQVITENLSATTTISVDYQLDNSVGTSTWTALSTTLDASPFHTAVIEQGGVFQIRLRFRMLGISNTAPPILRSWTVNGSVIEPQKYQWAMTCTVESDGEDLQGSSDTNPDTVDSWLKDMAARRVKLTSSSQKTSFHNKVVTVEAQTVRMQSIDTEEGSSKWKGSLWFTVREA